MPSPHYTTAKRQEPDPKTWPILCGAVGLERRNPEEADAGGDLDQV
jgi:hypothetical protein